MQADDNIAVSTINLFELQFGMAKSVNRAPMEAFLLATCRRYTVLDFDRPRAGMPASFAQSCNLAVLP
jgi:predicted nucleic acid-binding protein